MQGSPHRAEVRLNGTAAAPGVARATAYLLQQGRALVVRRQVDDPAGELARFEAALVATRAEIARLRHDVARKLNESEAAIFDAHLLVLEDVALIDEVTKEVRRTGYNVEHCFETVAQRYIDIFANMEDDFLRERAA
ncbi:phosphoenolpyruvate--protein phosphotransferase, partial [bacterium]|nr:phosphoenolpyruvate--protein phosphotransferase [bacterium]